MLGKKGKQGEKGKKQRRKRRLFLKRRRIISKRNRKNIIVGMNFKYNVERRNSFLLVISAISLAYYFHIL